VHSEIKEHVPRWPDLVHVTLSNLPYSGQAIHCGSLVRTILVYSVQIYTCATRKLSYCSP
jgi:hypothetical protein